MRGGIRGAPSIGPGGQDISILSDEFVYESLANWTTSTNGAGAAVSVNGSQSVIGHPGILDCETGTDAVGGAGVRRGVGGSYKLNGGVLQFDAVIKLDALATVAEDYILTVGLGTAFSASSAATATPGDDAVYLQYDRATSVNWIGAVKSGGTPTVGSGGTNVAVDTNWTNLRFIVNANATSVSFYVDGVLIGTSASNIPTAGIGIGFLIKKTAGNTEVDAFLDYIQVKQNMTTSRFS